MRFDVLTLFPEMFPGYLGQSLLNKAIESQLVSVQLHNLRDWSRDKHQTVDDRPFGGGPGMVLKVDTVVECVESVQSQAPEPAHVILFTPQGRRLNQTIVEELAQKPRHILLCGRYEGFDQRVIDILEPDEISIGDFVLNGGEVAAMVLIDALVRLVPGVLGDERSHQHDSFSSGHRLLEFAQYTRPREFRGHGVPEILLSGDHGRIAQWRAAESLQRTQQRRADLLAAMLPKPTSPRVATPRTTLEPDDAPPYTEQLTTQGSAWPRRPRAAPGPTPRIHKPTNLKGAIMNHNELLQLASQDSLKESPPEFEIGDTVDVHTKILGRRKRTHPGLHRHGHRPRRRRHQRDVHRATHRRRRRRGTQVPAALTAHRQGRGQAFERRPPSQAVLPARSRRQGRPPEGTPPFVSADRSGDTSHASTSSGSGSCNDRAVQRTSATLRRFKRVADVEDFWRRRCGPSGGQMTATTSKRAAYSNRSWRRK